MKKFARLKNPDLEIVGLVVAVKLLIFVFALLSYQIVSDRFVTSFYSVFEMWHQWDAVSYLKIAQNGYTATGEDRFLLAFFPLFPMLTALVALVVRDYLLSAFVVSTVSSIVAALVFRRLVRLDYAARTTRWAVLFMLIFPTAYFLHIPYTESLFLAVSLAAFLAARRRHWAAAGFFGFLACLTRINGMFLLPAFAFEVWEQYRATRRIDPRWTFLLLIPCGFGLYLLLNYAVTGHPLMFLTYQREHWGKYLRPLNYGVVDSFNSMFWKTPTPALMEGLMELFFVGLGLAAIVLGWRQMRNSYRVWMVCNWLIFTNTSFILSVPRYMLAMFPLFILMAVAARRHWLVKVVLVFWSVLMMALFVTQYVRAWWAF